MLKTVLQLLLRALTITSIDVSLLLAAIYAR